MRLSHRDRDNQAKPSPTDRGSPPLERIEYIGGPLADTSDERDSLPEEIFIAGGRYARSVRCADDGAMRYVWRPKGTG